MVTIAVEDSVSRAVVIRLLSDFGKSAEIGPIVGEKGVGYLRNKRRELNRSGGKIPIIMLIDADDPDACPLDIRNQWFPTGVNAKMLFRVAVAEVEAWLLADRGNLSTYLGVSRAAVGVDLFQSGDPKQAIVNLASRSNKRGIRGDLVPEKGVLASVGPNYNNRMIDFVENHWDQEFAASVSQSLRETREGLKRLLGMK